MCLGDDPKEEWREKENLGEEEEKGEDFADDWLSNSSRRMLSKIGSKVSRISSAVAVKSNVVPSYRKTY